MKSLMFYLLLIALINWIQAINLSLEGDDWFATNQNKSIGVKGRVPGSIYTDLTRGNVLKEDPYYGSNDQSYRWVAKDNWSYDKTFNVDESILSKRGVYLVCHGLDTISQIYINQKLIGSTDNMFVRYKFDIKRFLRLGQNSITISFESALTYSQRAHDQYVRTRYIVPPEGAPFAQKGDPHANYIRKMQASFSWDWGPSFPTQGIWKGIEIEAFDSAIIRDINVNTIYLNDNKWLLNTTLHLESIFKSPFEALLQLYIYDISVFSKLMTFSPAPDGNAILSLQIAINDSIVIHPWYPNGVGSQMLYDLKVILSTTEEVFDKTVRIGFRTVELIEDKLKPNALTFYFKVNGIPIFAKGTNWIPAHVFPELLTPDYLRLLLRSAKEANMNMMRVWGGGVYESDLFYQIADELGILIWQDFMFACALYPTNQEFLNSVDMEVTQQLRRLQYHPSIALWAGNNENEAAIAQTWWPEIFMNEKTYRKDYIELYVNHIRAIVLKEDISRPFLTSSPSNGLETIKENWLSNTPSDNRFGDVHYYYYGTNAWDWQTYPSTKFASEYGFQSFPSLKALSKVLNSSELIYPLSASMGERQHHSNGNNEITELIGNYMRLPVSGGSDRLDDFIYLSQIAQAMSLKTETEFYRRNRAFDSLSGNGFTMGALYWQLNDIWQAPTWSTIEFGGKWKMSHYFAKNMFENTLVIPFEDQNALKVVVVRDDYLGLVPLNVSIKFFQWSSLNPVYQIHDMVATNSMSSQVVFESLISNVLSSANCLDRNQCVIEVSVENPEKNLRSNNFMFLNELKNAIGITRPNLRVTQITGPHSQSPDYVYDIMVETNAIAPFVWLDFTLGSDIVGEFSDNGFVMFTNRRVLQFFGRIPIKIDRLKSELIIKSLIDVKTQ